MPTHRSVSVSLISQYDAQAISETLAPSSRNLLPVANRIITANIPILPASQFWISYLCPLPPPAKPGGDETKFYYFKLFAAGRCILSWAVSEDEDWQGKVVCGFWDAGTDFEGKRVVEKKGLFFPKVGGAGGFEIQVFRAKARKREDVKYEVYGDQGQGEGGLKINTIGRKKKGERQRFYTYALIDPKDVPFVTFRYVFRTKERLRQLEVQNSDNEEADEASTSLERDTATHDGMSHATPESPSPRSGIDLDTESPIADLRGRRARARRLSFPPRMTLQPNMSPGKPPSPAKKETPKKETSVDKYEDHLTDLTNMRALRTPSPPSGNSNCFNVSPGTPPSQRKAASNGLLRSVVASALRRREDRRK